MQKLKVPKVASKKKTLTNEHKEFLISEETLRKFASFSLKDRCVFFHR
jgi:hypothetical protein